MLRFGSFVLLPFALCFCASPESSHFDLDVSDGLVFSCFAHGPETGQPVLLIHGFPLRKEWWTPLMKAFAARGIRAVACDMRGYSPGAAPNNPEAYEPMELVGDVWGIADALGFEQFHLVGHDHGSALGWVVAATSKETHPDRLLSWTALSVIHPEMLSIALHGIFADPELQAACNYFPAFSLEDSASRNGGAIFDLLGGGGFATMEDLQRALWWYNGAVGPRGYLANVPVLSEEDMSSNPSPFAKAVRTAVPLPVSAGMGQAKELDPVRGVSTLFVCGVTDVYQRCSLSYTHTAIDFFVQSEYRRYDARCGHDLMAIGGTDGCRTEADRDEVVEQIVRHVRANDPSVAAFVRASQGQALDILPGMSIFWNVTDLDFELAIHAPTSGWVGFGIGEPTSGSMQGSDIVTAHVDSESGVVVAVDRYATSQSLPAMDCSQDWDVRYGEEADGATTVLLRRALKTNDGEDRDIIDNGEPTNIVVAMGPRDAFGYHGILRKATSIDVFGRSHSFAEVKSDDSLLQIDLRPSMATSVHADGHADGASLVDLSRCTASNPCIDGFEVPAAETTYVDFCYDLSVELEAAGVVEDQVVHLVGMGLASSTAEPPFLHHYVAYGHSSSKCSGPGTMLWAWAPGVTGDALPKEAGFPLRFGSGSKRGFQYVRLNVHYDNPTLVPGAKDNTGTRFYISTVLRAHDAGVLQLGDASVDLFGTKLPAGGTSKISFKCPSACTAGVEGTLHAYSNILHMHQKGVTITTKMTRDGAEVAEGLWNVDYFDFDQQHYNRRRYDILPGDAFETTCFWKTSPEESISFGLGSRNEMCINWIFYYPRSEFLERTAGFCGAPSDRGKCNAGISEGLQRVEEASHASSLTWPKPNITDPCSSVAVYRPATDNPTVETSKSPSLGTLAPSTAAQTPSSSVDKTTDAAPTSAPESVKGSSDVTAVAITVALVAAIIGVSVGYRPISRWFAARRARLEEQQAAKIELRKSMGNFANEDDDGGFLAPIASI